MVASSDTSLHQGVASKQPKSTYPAGSIPEYRAVLLEERGADGFREAQNVEDDVEIVLQLLTTGSRLPGDAKLDAMWCTAYVDYAESGIMQRIDF